MQDSKQVELEQPKEGVSQPLVPQELVLLQGRSGIGLPRLAVESTKIYWARAPPGACFAGLMIIWLWESALVHSPSLLPVSSLLTGIVTRDVVTSTRSCNFPVSNIIFRIAQTPPPSSPPAPLPLPIARNPFHRIIEWSKQFSNSDLCGSLEDLYGSLGHRGVNCKAINESLVRRLQFSSNLGLNLYQHLRRMADSGKVLIVIEALKSLLLLKMNPPLFCESPRKNSRLWKRSKPAVNEQIWGLQSAFWQHSWLRAYCLTQVFQLWPVNLQHLALSNHLPSAFESIFLEPSLQYLWSAPTTERASCVIIFIALDKRCKCLWNWKGEQSIRAPAVPKEGLMIDNSNGHTLGLLCAAYGVTWFRRSMGLTFSAIDVNVFLASSITNFLSLELPLSRSW